MKPNFLIMLILFIAPILHSQTPEVRLYKDAISLGMGGVGVSTIGYQNSVIRNPANLGLMTDFTIAPFISMGASINPDIISLVEKITPIATGVVSYDEIDYDSLLNQAPSLELNGPLNVGYMGKGFGFWTTSSADTVMAIVPNNDTNSFFVQNGISLSVNSIVDMASEIEKSLSDGKIDNITLAEIVNRHLGDSMEDSSLQELVTLLSSEDNIIEMLKGMLPLALLSMTAEFTVNVGYGYQIPFSAMDNVSGLSLGATVRFAQRYKATTGDSLESVYDLSENFNNLDKNLFLASTISSDFGMSLRLQNFILAVAVRDALSTGFAWKEWNGTDVINNTELAMSVDFGASYRFYFNNFFLQEVGMYVEIEDATSEYTSWGNKLRLGSEVKLFNFLDVRLGMYNQFITGGLGVGFKWFRMDFAYYREKYLDYFISDQYYLNMTVGLHSTPTHKANALKKQLEQDRIQAQNIEFLNQSLAGL